MANETVYPFGPGGQIPSGIAIVDDLTTGGADKALSAEQGKVLNQMINGGGAASPLSVVTISCGGRIQSDGTWSSNNNDKYYGAVIDISQYTGEKLRITAGGPVAGGAGGSVAFIKSSFSSGAAVIFATGWGSYQDMVAGEDYTFDIPSDAVYVYYYVRSNSTYYTPTAITIIMSFVDGLSQEVNYLDERIRREELCLFSYNIGHFSNGVHTTSDITSANYLQKVDGFRALLSKLNPDIYGVVEYSTLFGKNTDNEDVNTKDELFGLATTKYESTQLNYACYAMFANRIPIYNVKINDFTCLANETITHTTLVTAQDYRYISADLYAFGVSIRLVVTHLAFDSNRPGVLQQAQISELLTKYTNDNYVIMMGDWNYDNYSQFTATGYSLANNGSLITYPSGGTALDNICVKGLKIEDVKMISSNLSDHNPILCRVYKQ